MSNLALLAVDKYDRATQETAFLARTTGLKHVSADCLYSNIIDVYLPQAGGTIVSRLQVAGRPHAMAGEDVFKAICQA